MSSETARQPGQETRKQKQARVFREETTERLAELEETLLDLEVSPDDPELIGKAFRAMHTIKGAGAMFGYEQMSNFTHNIETVYQSVRDGLIPVTPFLIELTLAAHDQLVKMLDGVETAADIEKRYELSTAFRTLIPVGEEADNSSGTPPASPTTTQEVKTTGLVSYRIGFKPARNIFSHGTNPLLIIDELMELGDCQIIAKLDDIPALPDINPEDCYTSWDIILTSAQPKEAIEDVFIFIDASSEVIIEVIGKESDIGDDEPVKRVGEILVERGDIQREQLESVLISSDPIGKRLTEAGIAKRAQVELALAEQKAIQQLKERRLQKDMAVTSIRVESTKLDRLVDLVGELVTGQARLSQVANESKDAILVSIAEEIERLTMELRDSTMSVRLLTFDNSFKRFKRLVRDLAVETSTEVRLLTNGAETELDKSVIDQLNDPIIHILRNCVDHGIEPPEVREEKGKPRQGTIELSAGNEGDHVVITISDDGAGMDVEEIREKAISRGLIQPDSRLSDKEILALVFEPGFSTAKTVTSVSGRGVGMDIVKKSIESLRGKVDLESQPGVGTKLTISLPLTLAIIDGLLVKVGEDRYIIPLSLVEECIELTREDIQRFHGRHIIDVRDQVVPYIRLNEMFCIDRSSPDIEQVVVTRIDHQLVGFVVDHVIGQHQTVIKHLSKLYQNIDSISGATIMADGTVALIVDVMKLAKHTEGIELSDQVSGEQVSSS